MSFKTSRSSNPLISLLLLGACASPDAAVGLNAGADSVDADEFAGFSLGAPDFTIPCQVDEARFEDVTVEQTEVPTVLEVTWTGPAGDAGWVAWSEEGGETFETGKVITESGFHRILVRGLHPLREVAIRLMSDVGDEVRCSSPIVTDTGAFSAELPLITFTPDQAEAVDGYVYAPLLTTGTTWLTVIDSDGEYVWALPYNGSAAWRMRPSMDGTSILFNVPASTPIATGRIMKASFDGTVSEVLSYTGLHSDFVQLVTGQIGFLTKDVREVEINGEQHLIMGDDIVEWRGDGSFETVWSTFDSYEIKLNQVWGGSEIDELPGLEEWGHVNYLSYDGVDDSWLVSIPGLSGVASVDRASGTANWTVSQDLPGPSFTAVNGLIRNPHSINRVGDEFVVFNRNDYSVGECSEAIRVDLDEETDMAEEVWSYASDECFSVYYLGEVQPIVGGNLQVTFTTSGRMEQITPDGERAWSLQTAIGAGIGFSSFRSSMYPNGH